MIHGHSAEECRSVVREIAADTGVTAYCELRTLREYKKVRVTYYGTRQR
jgi:hypothetical protein